MITHKFEEAGLGKAPFRFVGFSVCTFQACPGAPIQPGTCCDYCGTGIMDVFEILSADGKRFKVGCDCVRKTGDKGLVDTVKRAANRVKTERRHEIEKVKIVKIHERWKDESLKAHFKALPHPNEYWASKGKTKADYIDFILDRGGNAGRLSVGRILENFNEMPKL